MKSSSASLLALIMAALLATPVTHSDSGSSGIPLDRGRFVMPFGFSPDTGERVLSFEDEFDDEEDFDGLSTADAPRIDGDDSSKSWLLRQDTFERLSSAGQRAVLLANRRLRSHPAAQF